MMQSRWTSILAGAGVLAGVINSYIASTPDKNLPKSIKKYRFWISLILLSIIAIASYNNPTTKDF